MGNNHKEQIGELNSQIEELRRRNQNLKSNNENLSHQVANYEKIVLQYKTILEKDKKTKIPFKFDIGIRMESLNDLLNGWDITYGIEGKNKYLEMINKDILLIGILGLKNKGKS